MSIRVCFVCLGNICRSPTAEAVMLQEVESAGLAHAILIDSAGTSAHHIGESPDTRSTQAAAERGIPIGIINNAPTRADGLLEKVDPRMKTLGGVTQIPPTVIKFEVDQLAAVIPLVAAMV